MDVISDQIQEYADPSALFLSAEETVLCLYEKAEAQSVLSRRRLRSLGIGSTSVELPRNDPVRSQFFEPVFVLLLSTPSKDHVQLTNQMLEDLQRAVDRQGFDYINPWHWAAVLAKKMNITFPPRSHYAEFLPEETFIHHDIQPETLFELTQSNSVLSESMERLETVSTQDPTPSSSSLHTEVHSHALDDEIISLDECIHVSIECARFARTQNPAKVRHPVYLKDDVFFPYCFAFFALDAPLSIQERKQQFENHLTERLSATSFNELDVHEVFVQLCEKCHLPEITDEQLEEALDIAQAPFPQTQMLGDFPTTELHAGLVLEKFIHRRQSVPSDEGISFPLSNR